MAHQHIIGQALNERKRQFVSRDISAYHVIHIIFVYIVCSICLSSFDFACELVIFLKHCGKIQK